MANSQSGDYLCISHCNAQSLVLNFADVQRFMTTYGVHVMAISETFLKKKHKQQQVCIPHYKLHRSDRKGKRGGGIGLYVHESIESRVIKKSPVTTTYVKRPEYLFVKLAVGCLKFLCVVVYNPPRTGFWGETIEEELMNCNGAYDNIFLLGDFNIDWYSSKSPRTTLTDSLRACNLSRLPFDGTHHGANPFSTIGYFCLLDDSKLTFLSQHYWPGISQHEILLACFKYKRPELQPKKITRRCFKNFNQTLFYSDVQTADWLPFLSLTHVNDKVSFYENQLLRLYNSHAPLQTFTARTAPN